MKEGDVFESVLDGGEYEVRRIVNEMVVLSIQKRKQANLDRSSDPRNNIALSEKGGSH